MPTIRTTMQPGVDVVVSDAEYERLLELGVIYDGTPPVEPADTFDLRMAARIDDVDSHARAAIDGLITDLSVVDASAAVKGIIQLSGDLGGTATSPTVPGLAAKAPLASPAFTGTPTGITKTHVGLGNVDNTSDASKPVSTATTTALSGKANSTHTHVATTDLTATGTKDTSTFLRGDNTWAAPTGVTAPDASDTVKGIVELATTAETTTGTDTVRAVTPAGVKAVGDTKALATRTVTAGTGLTGGGDLSADRTLAVSYGSTSGTAVQGNDARVTADQVVGTASIRTLGTGAQQASAGNHSHTAYTETLATAPAGSVFYVDQNDPAGTWPNRPTSRTDVKVIWTKTVVGSSDPAAATSPAVNGAYSKDLVVGV